MIPNSGDLEISTKAIQEAMKKHDRVVVQINFIKAYIARLRRQALRAMLLGHKGHALHYMGRKSVAEAIKHLYKQYRERQWHQVQTLVSSLLTTIQPTIISPPPVAPGNTIGEEGEQVQKYSQTMIVAFCNFNRRD